jgi:hypothetical protein
MIKNVSFIFMLMLLVLPDVQAQNSTSSPFSIFGIGEIETREFGRTTAMGSTGIGFQSENFLNRRNPAGLSGIDTLRFILDVSASLKMSQFRTKTLKEQSTVFNFKSLAVGVRLSKRWTSSVGLSPYSNAGYKFTDTQTISGTEFTTVYSSSGGINRFYWGNAFEIFKGFSIGVNSSFIFGNISKNEDMSVFSIKDTYNVNKLYFDFGAQYSQWFGQYTRVVIGGVYGYKSEMPIQHKLMIISNNTIEQDQRKPDRKSYMPETYGGGFSILRNKRAAEWVFAADCQYWNWSVDPLNDKGKRYSDSRIISAGLRVTPKRYTENYLLAIRYHLGASYNQSYLKINGYQMDDMSVSLGFGLPFINKRTYERSYVNVAAIFGESGTGQKGGITERYILFSVNLSLIEQWFAKRPFF